MWCGRAKCVCVGGAASKYPSTMNSQGLFIRRLPYTRIYFLIRYLFSTQVSTSPNESSSEDPISRLWTLPHFSIPELTKHSLVSNFGWKLTLINVRVASHAHLRLEVVTRSTFSLPRPRHPKPVSIKFFATACTRYSCRVQLLSIDARKLLQKQRS